MDMTTIVNLAETVFEPGLTAAEAESRMAAVGLRPDAERRRGRGAEALAAVGVEGHRQRLARGPRAGR